jgi:putative ABC transport system substrate-binding protein
MSAFGCRQQTSSHFQLLKEIIPALKNLGVLAPRNEWEQTPFGKSVFETAQSAGISVIGPPVESPMQEQDFRASLNAMTGKIDALLVSFASESTRHRRMIVQFAQEQNLPALYANPFFVREGGLMSYGPDFGEVGKGVARYVDLILKGANAGDLPIQLPVKFDLIINLKTAKALGLTVPPSLRVRSTLSSSTSITPWEASQPPRLAICSVVIVSWSQSRSRPAGFC